MYQIATVNEVLQHQAAFQAVEPGETDLNLNEREVPQGLFSCLPPPTD